MNKMKIIIAVLAIVATSMFAKAQTLNWNNLSDDQKHIINLSTGVAYGATFGVGYGYHLKSKLPLVLNAEWSTPAGKNLFDDFTTKVGAQARLFEWKSFCFTAEAKGIFRRYESPYVRLLNFGSEFSGTLGYYHHSWFVGAQLGFDKAIVTHFKNSALLLENNPGLQNGWYEPATGGNFFYGLQGGCSFRQFDIYAKAGKVIEQDFQTSPLLPFYAQVGGNWKLR